MRTIRASEIGSFLFCRRAWWYQKQGLPSSNRLLMEAGDEFHLAHGTGVARASLFSWLGWILLLAAMVLLAIILTLLFLHGSV
jgi:hypothetical protein